jgi:hypothetical protein
MIFFPFPKNTLMKLQMDRSSKNENKVSGNETSKVFMNDITMEEQEVEKRSEDNHDLQFETNKIATNKENNENQPKEVESLNKGLETS